MNCRSCNTRMPSGAKTCPHCGAEARGESSFSGQSRPTMLPAPELSTARDPEDAMVELDETAEDLDDEPPAPRAREVAPRRRPAPRETPRPAPAPAPAPAAEPPIFAADAAGVRALIAERPETLEPGLEVYRDSRGTPLGAGYASGVGDIDLLARDSRGELVVVMVSGRGDDGEELVAEVLQRVGWVRKHVASGKGRVRGIVLCEEPPENLTYTAAAVADTLQFKTFRVALSFEDVEI